MKKQKIEDIFSSMEDFSSVPPPELWGQIEEKLNKPKKKKRVVLWWSAAACLLLGLLLPSILHFTGSPQNKNLNNGGIENNTVVLDENKNQNNTTKNTISKENDNQTLDTRNGNSFVKNKLDNPQRIQNKENAVAHSDSKNKNTKSNSKIEDQINRNIPNQNFGNQNFIASEEKAATKSSTKISLVNNKKTANKGISEERIAFGKSGKFNSTPPKQLSNSIFEEKFISKTNKNFAFSNNENAIANTTSKQNLNNSKNNIAEKATNNITKENSKFGSALTKHDSVQLAELQNLEKGILPLDEKEDKKEKKDKKLNLNERWAVAVFAGVANSENTRNEKTLGNVNDSKQSNSYGVKTKYNLSNKWAVSSGFKLNELGQSVANVSYVSAKNNALFVSGANTAEYNAAPVSSSEYILISNTTKEALKSDNVQSGKLDQNLRYIEMPLEVSYSVFNRNKASINLNTGGFVGKLISNNVALDGQNIGQNATANDYVYGSTLSSTIQYRVYKKTNVFVEPAVNYYINPLNNQSFNQFQWGLNFGLNVSF